MFKALVVSLLLALATPYKVYAQEVKAFITIVNPVRGSEFWELKDQRPVDAVLGQLQVLNKFLLPATWLMRFDSLNDTTLVAALQKSSLADEKGLLLEITPSLAEAAQVAYHNSPSWHFAGSVFLIGYSQVDREKLIDTSFYRFKDIWGYFPKSVGAWWVDSYSLEYMYKKYGISGSLIVADQYTTDNYQIWGQYFGTPYYPNKINALVPAQNSDSKLPVVITQWAQRDPVNGYGGSVSDSTYSVQANDYIVYHKLDTGYFSKLLDIYLDTKLNTFGQVTVGLENTYSWRDFADEYSRQADVISSRVRTGTAKIATMTDFASWYKKRFEGVSPRHIIVANDPLGSEQKAIWYMNPYFRAGWSYNKKGSVFQDIRQYGGDKELCYSEPCEKLNFATSALRVLDFVTYGQDWLIDRGNITNFQVVSDGDKFLIDYFNEAGKERQITFLNRDILIDGSTYNIDGAILKAQSEQINQKIAIPKAFPERNIYKNTIFELVVSLLKFLGFLFLAVLVPGFLFIYNLKDLDLKVRIFLSIGCGLSVTTLLGFIFSYLHLFWMMYLYVAISLILAIKLKIFTNFKLPSWKFNYPLTILILLGVIFQSLSLIKSGWVYDFGIGFWGPLGHDGVWHQALVNQLIKDVPPKNPIFSNTNLTNYHYFYDLMIAITQKLSGIPVLDLIYRFFPVLFSILLGVGSFVLAKSLFKNTLAALLSVYFAYFGSSFGWIVEYIREKHFGGESAFWVNQPVSFNLNPPFAISLILLITLIIIFQKMLERRKVLTSLIFILIAGALIEFKVYAGIIVLGALFLTGIYNFILRKDWYLLVVASLSLILSVVLFLPQNSKSGELLVFAPFWFVHSMIDFPDRVGWLKLSSARQAYVQRGNYSKFLVTEALGFLIFIFGNLGTRVMSILLVLLTVKNRLRVNTQLVFILSLTLISVLIPVFLIQKGNPWNTIQFMYYFLYFASFSAGFSCYLVFKSRPGILFKTILGFILLITPISSYATFRSSLYPNPPSRLTIGELEALDFLKKQPAGTVLTPPFIKTLRNRLDEPFPLLGYESTSYVSAFSAHETFVEDELQQEILQNNYEKRIVAAKEFFSSKDSLWSRKLLKDEHIRYVYLPKILDLRIEAEKVDLKKIFDNAEVELFEVNS